MENSYICKYGLYHDKPVTDGEPSSNNGWIYTAYAKALGFFLPNRKHYQDLNAKCMVQDQSSDFYRYRLPGLVEPPISRDEIIGMHVLNTNIDFLLGYVYGWYLTRRQWQEYSMIQAIKALWAIRKEHRNYFWKNKIYPAYKLAFKLMPHDRYFIKATSELFKPNLYEWVMFQVYALATILQKNYSARNILWLQLNQMHSVFWINFVNQPKNFENYFREGHPFRK